MVKGVTRQVVLVRSPDPELFEQAIFIVRGDRGSGVTQEDILRQARGAASRFLIERNGRWSGRLVMRLGWAALGAVAVGLVWLLTALL